MYEYITTEEQLIKAAIFLKSYAAQTKNPKLAFDFETYFTEEGLKLYEQGLVKLPKPIKLPSGEWVGKTSTMQLGCDTDICDRQFILDVRKLGENMIANYLGDLLSSVVLVGHNLGYDVGFLITQYGIWPNIMRDTMLIVQILMAGDKFNFGLANCYRKFLDYHWFKSETGRTFDQYEEDKEKYQLSDWNSELSKEQLQYAADDVRLIWFLYKGIMEELDRFVGMTGRSGIYETIKFECRAITEYCMFEIRGADFDKEIHENEVIAFFEEQKKKYIDTFGEVFYVEEEKGRGANKTIVRRPIKNKSYKEIPEALEKAGLHVENTQETTLKRLLYELGKEDFYYDPIRALVNSRSCSTLLSGFGEKLIKKVFPDGKIRPSVFQIGTVSGRSAYANPNLQQTPMRNPVPGTEYEDEDGKIKLKNTGEFFRKSFVAGKGNKLVVTDLSQIEPRMTAQFTKDAALVAELNKPKADTHALTAKALLKLDYMPAKGTYEREYIGKTANLAMSYGIGPNKLGTFMFDETIDNPVPIKWSLTESKEYLAAYYEMFAGIKEAMKEVEQKLLRQMRGIDSLEYFRGRKPIFIEFTMMGRPRRWCLTKIQEQMAREEPEKLHKNYRVHRIVNIVDEYGNPLKDANGNNLTKVVESRWNEYYRTLNNIAREAYNHKIQGSSADLFKLGVIEIGKRLHEIPGYNPITEGIIMVIHDEVVLRIREEYAEQAQQIVLESLTSEGKKLIKVVPVTAGSAIGDSWAECKG